MILKNNIMCLVLKVSILLITVSVFLTAHPVYSFSLDNTDYKIFKVTMEGTTEKSVNNPVKDFYINAGSDDGISKSMILDVYRKKMALDKETGKEFQFAIHVGRLKVFKLFKDITIGRLHSLTTSKKTPVLQYRAFMIGDNVVPRVPSKKAAPEKKDKASFSISKEQLSQGILLPSNVLFTLSEWHLKPDAMEILAEVSNILKKSKDYDLLIEGHTCSLGTKEYNLELSRKRAQAVGDFFKESGGIAADKIDIKFFGEESPIVPNTTEDGRQKNRRVVIRFIPSDSKHT